MSSLRPEPPAAHELLSTLRTGAQSATTRAGILIDSTAVAAFVDSLQEEDWAKERASGLQGIRLPLRFETNEEELNLIGTLALLNFLSGHRAALHRLTTRGAYSTILLLLLSAHLSPSSTSPLTTAGLCAVTPNSLAALIQMSLTKEIPHPEHGRAILMSVKDEEAHTIVNLLSVVCKETGRILQELEYKSLGEWIKAALIETKGDSGKMLEKLTSTFPAFNDAQWVDDEPVYIYKKALFLLASISHRFAPVSEGESSNDRDDLGPVNFPVPSAESLVDLPIFADNVIPTLLIHMGIINLASASIPELVALVGATSPASHLLEEGPASTLRAAAIVACASIVAHAKAQAVTVEGKAWLGNFTEVQLDNYLWSLGKKGEYKDLERIAQLKTVFY